MFKYSINGETALFKPQRNRLLALVPNYKYINDEELLKYLHKTQVLKVISLLEDARCKRNLYHLLNQSKFWTVYDWPLYPMGTYGARFPLVKAGPYKKGYDLDWFLYEKTGEEQWIPTLEVKVSKHKTKTTYKQKLDLMELLVKITCIKGYPIKVCQAYQLAKEAFPENPVIQYWMANYKENMSHGYPPGLLEVWEKTNGYNRHVVREYHYNAKHITKGTVDDKGKPVKGTSAVAVMIYPEPRKRHTPKKLK